MGPAEFRRGLPRDGSTSDYKIQKDRVALDASQLFVMTPAVTPRHLSVPSGLRIIDLLLVLTRALSYV